MTGATFFFDIAAKGFLLLAATSLMVAGMRSASAATRHMVWLIALVALAALPAMKGVLPAWSPPGSATLIRALPAGARGEAPPPPASAAVADRSVASSPRNSAIRNDADPNSAAPTRGPVEQHGGADEAATVTRATGDAAESSGVATRTRGSGSETRNAAGLAGLAERLQWGWLLAALWAAGALALLARLGAGVAAVVRVSRIGRPLRHGPAHATARRLSSEAGIRAPRLLEVRDDLMPMAWGVLRPTVALPASAANWSRARLEAVLRHEIAHLRRRDPLSQWLADLVCAVHWFNPLAWYAAARLRAERELACDDEVLAAGSRPTDYAAELVGVARSLRARAPSPALPMARPSQLTARVEAALDAGRRRTRVSERALAAALAVALMIAAPVAALAPGAEAAPVEAAEHVPAMEPAPTPTDGGVPLDLDVSAEPGHPGLTPSGYDGAPERCWEGDWKGSRSHNVNDDSQRVRWSSNGCELDLRIDGEIRFSTDMSGIEWMAPGSRFVLEEDDGRDTRRIEAVPGAGGTPVFSYRLNRETRPFDEEARTWFANLAFQLARNSGLFARQRVAGLLRDGGPDAVLAEIDELAGNWVRSVYFRELIDQADLTPAEVVRGMDLARVRLGSDHYLSEVVRALATETASTPETRAAMVAAVTSMESDHYRAEVLGEALAAGALGPGSIATLIEAAGHLGSDHYRAEILTGAAATQQLSSADRDAYVRVARAMESDHYRAEVLEALLAHGGEGVAAAVADAAAEAVESDHYRSEIVTRAVGSAAHDRTAQEAFVRTVAATKSDHYQAEMVRAFLDAGGTDPEVIATALVAARSIDSDHYLSEVLVTIAERTRLEGALRDAFEETMAYLDSERAYGRVSRMLNR